VALRAIGTNMEQAATRLSLPWSAAVLLEARTPDPEMVSLVVRRARSAPGPRGVNGNAKLLISEQGMALLQWLLNMSLDRFDHAAAALVREIPFPDNDFWDTREWDQLSAALPAGLSLAVRVGAAYLDDEDLAQGARPGIRFTLTADKRIGRRPMASLIPTGRENRVQSSRLTAVARLLVLSIRSFRKLQKNQ